MYLMEKVGGQVHASPAKALKLRDIGTIRSPLSQKVLQELARSSNYPKAIARELKENEQKIYYHIRQLERSGFIELVRTELSGGAKKQYYALASDAFIIRLRRSEKSKEVSTASYDAYSFLDPFVQDGRMNALIVVGSPDPHGPHKARSRDGYYGMDFALFLGSYMNEVKDLAVRLDTEITEKELRDNNIILLGGPIVNAIVAKAQKKMPIHIDNHTIISTKSKKEYFSEETGYVVRMRNPFNPKKMMLAIIGLRHTGTRACMLLFNKRFHKLIERFDPKEKVFSCVVEGYDMDSDGIIDDVKILES